MLIRFIKPDFRFDDERGSLTQLVREGYRQINVVSSRAGVVRGGHYHRENREAFYVISGSFRLCVSDGAQEEAYEMCQGDFFVVPPMVAHSFTYYEDTLLVGLYDVGVEHPDGSKDIFPAGEKEGGTN